jgi:uncharacterized protein YigE (DUF2233 family)
VRRAFLLAVAALLAACAPAAAGCRMLRDVAVCEAPSGGDLRVLLRDGPGALYGEFDPLRRDLAGRGEVLRFAMNAGMYQPDRSPVGLLVQDGAALQPLNTADACGGNFCLKPNGVFWTDAAGAHVAATEAYLAAAPTPAFATQSGPMLVVDGAIHPKLSPASTSLYVRNGVGQRADGSVVLALTDAPMSLYAFAQFFRDTLKAENALYLHGAISRLYAPELGRNDPGARMGPILAFVIPALKKEVLQ